MDFVLLGFIMFITPPVLLLMAGVRDEADLIQWMMDQDLGFLVFLQQAQVSGLVFISVGGVM